jgi:beta-lactamase superfamily II metal-dependent hydrolase
VILSHPHKDHVELLPDVLDRYEVSHVWDSGAANGECMYERLISLVSMKQIAYASASQDEGAHLISFTKRCKMLKASYVVTHGERITRGLRVPLGGHASMVFLHTDPKTETDLNDDSLVVRLDLGAKRVLLMGTLVPVTATIQAVYRRRRASKLSS